LPIRQEDAAANSPEREELLRFRSLGRFILSAIASGIDWIQIREKDAPASLLYTVAAGAASPLPRLADWSAAKKSSTNIIINDRLDVALAARTGGVHLGETSIPVAQAIAWLRNTENRFKASERFLVGASCHSLDSALAAERHGASYIFFGPVFSTPSKTAFGAPQGLERLTEISRAVQIPVLAIGGITLENAWQCISAGSRGIAAIRMFQQATNLRETITKLRASFATPAG
jgi:thiamine-phosphate pyrophosphorylase